MLLFASINDHTSTQRANSNQCNHKEMRTPNTEVEGRNSLLNKDQKWRGATPIALYMLRRLAKSSSIWLAKLISYARAIVF